ncbi:MAG: ubiquitin-like domain-containing protein [Vulcanimicrobiaceae bacterium]
MSDELDRLTSRFAACALGVALLAAATRVAFSAQAAAGTDSTVPVTLSAGGVLHRYATDAPTVGAFLAQSGIALGPDDRLAPSPDARLVPGMHIRLERAHEITLDVRGHTISLTTFASTVAELLRERGIRPTHGDRVIPALEMRLGSGERVHVERIARSVVAVRKPIAPLTRGYLDSTLAPNATRTVFPGRSGLRERLYRVVRIDGKPAARRLLASRILRAPRERVLAYGSAVYGRLARIAHRGFKSTLHLAGVALHVVATAYTGTCGGCSGITASGRPAGPGIVAVDPRVIPLGSRLYISGYGRAIAGDTGGAIVGNRIDLGYSSQAQALAFGRRAVTVYVLP